METRGRQSGMVDESEIYDIWKGYKKTRIAVSQKLVFCTRTLTIPPTVIANGSETNPAQIGIAKSPFIPIASTVSKKRRKDKKRD